MEHTKLNEPAYCWRCGHDGHHAGICPDAIRQSGIDERVELSLAQDPNLAAYQKQQMVRDAAPALLEALKEVKRWNDISLIDDEWPCVMESVNAAIAKAEGGRVMEIRETLLDCEYKGARVWIEARMDGDRLVAIESRTWPAAIDADDGLEVEPVTIYQTED